MSSNQQDTSNSEAATETANAPSNEQHNAPQQAANMNEAVPGDEQATAHRRQLEEEERKLVTRHPSVQQRPVSEFLQKRLQRGQKYFDSGDYNMAKASTNPNIKLPEAGIPVTAIDGKILNKQRH